MAKITQQSSMAEWGFGVLTVIPFWQSVFPPSLPLAASSWESLPVQLQKQLLRGVVIVATARHSQVVQVVWRLVPGELCGIISSGSQPLLHLGQCWCTFYGSKLLGGCCGPRSWLVLLLGQEGGKQECMEAKNIRLRALPLLFLYRNQDLSAGNTVVVATYTMAI